MSWYEFRLRGRLDAATLAAFGDFTSDTAPVETVLCGRLGDEDDVSGVLARIQDLGLELVALRRLPEDPETTNDDQETP